MSYPITPNPVIHQPTKQSVAPVSTPVSSGTLQAWGTHFIEGIVGKVASALTGGLVNQNSVQVLANWGSQLGSDISGVTNGLSTLGNNLLHNASLVIGDISGVVADGTHALQNVWDALTSGLGGAATGNTAATLNAQAVAVAQQAQAAEAAAYAAQWALQQQSSGSNAGTGAVFEMDITGNDGDPLPSADWPTVSGLDVRVTNSSPAMGIAAAVSTGTVCYANCAHNYTTDSQSIAVVLGANGDSTAPTTLHFHCNSAYTTGIYLDIVTSGVTLGYFSGAVGSRTYTPFSGGTISKKLSGGKRVEVRNNAVANTYDVLFDGAVVGSVSDSGAHAVAGNYYAQITQNSRSVVYNAGLPWQTTGTAYSFRLASILVSDFVIPTSVGSGARLYRTSTSSVSTTGILASSYFGVLANSTPDITVDLTNSKFTVSVEGRYLVTMRSKLSLNPGYGNSYVTPQLYVNGSLSQWGTDACGYENANDGTFFAAQSIGFSWPVYLHAGDYVQVGWAKTLTTSATASLSGEATGTQTFFDIELLTKKGS